VVKLQIVRRKSPVLSPSTLACLSHIPTVNLTMGCAHGCLYCYTRGYRAYPGQDRVALYGNTLEKLQNELRRKKRKPHAVYFSPASDLFQPLPEVLDLAYEILHEILRRGIGVAFLTKGAVPQRHMDLLKRNAALVRAQIGLITLDEEVLSTFEPNAAPPGVRLSQLRDLNAGGIRTQIRIDPILPGLTDTSETFERLCAAASNAGVKDAAASSLFIRPAPLRKLREAAATNALAAKCLAAFHDARRLAIHAERSTVTALPACEREKVFRRLEQVAERFSISVKRCACKNPDIATGICSIGGDWTSKKPQSELCLFD
jgi:DNA repair photolyase